MRKLKLQVQMSADGFVARPGGELDWMTWNWSDDIKNHVNELTDSSDTILMGRKMSAGFLEHWGNIVKNAPGDPSHPFAKKMMDTPKVIFSKTLERPEWEHTAIARGDMAEEVNKLKQQSGKDIIVYGGAGFVSSLIKAGLVDEWHLFINPCVIGKGMTIFNLVEEQKKLSLVKATPFDCGIVSLCYRPVNQ